MARMKPPLVPAKPVPIVPADGLKRLFAACAGASFEARRDTALVMLLLDTGARREEMAGLTLADVDLDLDVLLVLGKGRRERTLPFGRKSGEALDRYLRVRARHKDAELPWLWLGKKGQLTAWGLVPPYVVMRSASTCRRRRRGPQVRQERGRADESIARSAPCGAAASFPLVSFSHVTADRRCRGIMASCLRFFLWP
jgi:integrase